MRPDDEELQQYFASRIKDCLKLPAARADHAIADASGCQNDILKQLSSNLSHQIESLEESNRISKLEYDRKIEKEEKQKDCLKKLPSSVLHQYLMVSSVDGEQKAADLVDSCKSFFNQDSVALSDQELVFQLKNRLRRRGLQPRYRAITVVRTFTLQRPNVSQ